AAHPVEEVQGWRVARVERDRAFEFALRRPAQPDIAVQLREHDVIRDVAGVERDGGLQLRLGLTARSLVEREHTTEVRAVARLLRHEPRRLAEQSPRSLGLAPL